MKTSRIPQRLVGLMLVSVFGIVTHSVLAQAPPGQEVCYESPENRYACFMGSYSYTQERASIRKDVQAQRDAASSERLAAEAEAGPQLSENRQRELEWMRLQLEYSRARSGISQAGRPYSLVHGVILEPGPKP